MKVTELFESTIMPEVGKCYKLPDLPLLGDYAGLTVFVETGPRNAGKPNEQYRVSTGYRRFA